MKNFFNEGIIFPSHWEKLLPTWVLEGCEAPASFSPMFTFILMSPEMGTN